MKRRALFVLVAAVVAAATTAAAGVAAGPALDATHAYLFVTGYFDSFTGCGDSPPATGPAQTFSHIGEIWYDGGQLHASLNLGDFDSVAYTGTLGADGAFSLSGADAIYPSVTDTFAGQLRADGIVMQGSLTSPYLETCILHGTITRGRVQLPTAATPGPSPGKVPPAAQKRLDAIAKRLAVAPARSRARVWEAVAPQLTALEPSLPGLALAVWLDGVRGEAPVAAALAAAGVAATAKSPATAAADLLAAKARLLGVAAGGNDLVYQIAKTARRLEDAGLPLAPYIAKDPTLKAAVDKGTQLVKGGVDEAQLKKLDASAAASLVDTLFGGVPAGALPMKTSVLPAVVAVQKWTADLTNRTSDALGVVADAIQTGHVDHKRLAADQAAIRSLANNGPWSLSTFGAMAKKTLQEIPYVGKLLSVFWR